jgi:hypothetical protein
VVENTDASALGERLYAAPSRRLQSTFDSYKL